MKNRVVVLVISLFFLTMSAWCILEETPDYSESERRVLASFPEVNVADILSGEFSEGFDEYAVERFPVRDAWRKIKAYSATKVLGQKDNHQIYTAGNHISKMEYPMNLEMANYATEVFTNIKDTYLEENEIYLVVIPDKNRYLAEQTGHLKMDYELFSNYIAEHMQYAEYIEIADLLEADDYYFTDSHWRQEKIVDVADRIAETMGTDISAEYSVHQLENPFRGVYLGQSALEYESDTITYLVNDTMEAAVVEGADAIYDKKKANGVDAYELFLSGNQPVITIKNTQNSSGKRLVMFRDSYGSSIAPLLMEGYSEIVLIDLRYLPSNMLAEYVDFKDADVLFLYSTLILNNSRSIK